VVLDKYDLIVFDADGTLRECKDANKFYPLKPDEWYLKEEVVSALSSIDWNVKTFGVATNQPGISRNEFTEIECRSLLNEMCLQAFGIVPEEQAIQICPHHIDGACECRKPAPGMLETLMHTYGVSSSRTVFIGDREKDKAAALSAGCDFIWVHEVTTTG
jgi:histidinol-phosphate phosphatase family protein